MLKDFGSTETGSTEDLSETSSSELVDSVSNESDIPTDKTDKRIEELKDMFSNLKIEVSDDEGNPQIITFTKLEIENIFQSNLGDLYTPETLEKVTPTRFVTNVKNLGISPSAWKATLVSFPTLMKLTPERITCNISVADQLNVNREEYIQAALKYPPLFARTPETVSEHINNAATVLGTTNAQYIHSALQYPPLFGSSSERISSHVTNVSELLNIDRKSFIDTALRYPSLLGSNPETIAKNVSQTSELLGVEKQKYIAAAMKVPSLFCQAPETISANVSNGALQLGIEKDQYIDSVLQKPSILTFAPVSLRGKFDVLVIFYGSEERAREMVLARPAILTYSKSRDLLHYFAMLITGNESGDTKNPENIIRNYFSNDPSKAERVIESIKDMYTNYTEREKKEASLIRKQRIEKNASDNLTN